MNHPFEHILLATEHTEFDAGAERLAFEMVKRCDMPLSAVLPVVSNPEYEIIAPQLAEHAELEAAAKIHMLDDAARAAGIELEINARRGEEPYREIVAEARERGSDLIVTRRRGKRSFLSDLLIGEMVSKVVREAPCSVLFVPRAAQMWSHGILAGVDNSSSAELVALAAARIAAQCGVSLTLVSVVSHDADSARAARTLEQAKGVAAAVGVQAQSRILHGKSFEQILAASDELAADLIIVGRHGESHVLRAPFGGTTHKVVGLAEIPVLVVHG